MSHCKIYNHLFHCTVSVRLSKKTKQPVQFRNHISKPSYHFQRIPYSGVHGCLCVCWCATVCVLLFPWMAWHHSVSMVSGCACGTWSPGHPGPDNKRYLLGPGIQNANTCHRLKTLKHFYTRIPATLPVKKKQLSSNLSCSTCSSKDVLRCSSGAAAWHFLNILHVIDLNPSKTKANSLGREMKLRLASRQVTAVADSLKKAGLSQKTSLKRSGVLLRVTPALQAIVYEAWSRVDSYFRTFSFHKILQQSKNLFKHFLCCFCSLTWACRWTLVMRFRANL